MSDCECPKELVSQSSDSPGLVEDGETIVYVLTDPLTYENGSVKLFKKDHLQKATLSVCRADFCTGDEARRNTTDALLSSDPTRKDEGYVYALCSEIRGIMLNGSTTKAFCVIDDTMPGYSAHAHLGYSVPQDLKIRSHRETARANLLKLFQRRGRSLTWESPPFRSTLLS